VYGFRPSPIDTIPLIHIPDWDFDWQGMYVHTNLVKIPAGYKLGSKHVYDNTINNPNNPNNPPQTVVAGTSTTDEMFFDSFQWMYYQSGMCIRGIVSMGLGRNPYTSMLLFTLCA